MIEKIITLNNLTQDNVEVSIKFTDYVWNKNTSKIPEFKKTFTNSPNNREYLSNFLSTDKYNELLEVWGEEATQTDETEVETPTVDLTTVNARLTAIEEFLAGKFNEEPDVFTPYTEPVEDPNT